MEHVALGLRLARGRAVVPDLKDTAMQVVQRIRLSALMLLAIGLASCASVPGSAVLHPVSGPAGVGKPVDVLVATTRLRSEADGREFTAERNRGVSYAAYAVSVPPDHVAGEIEWPTTLPGNPATHFVVTGSQSLDKAGFSRTAMRDMKPHSPDRRRSRSLAPPNCGEAAGSAETAKSEISRRAPRQCRPTRSGNRSTSRMRFAGCFDVVS